MKSNNHQYKDLNENQIQRLEKFIDDIRLFFKDYPEVLDNIIEFLVQFEKNEETKKDQLILVGSKYPLIEYDFSINVKRSEKTPHLEALQKAAESDL